MDTHEDHTTGAVASVLADSHHQQDTADAHLTHDSPTWSGQDRQHAGHQDHGEHGDHIGTFRHRFWWSLLLTLPVIATSHMIMDWAGYDLGFYGMEWVGPILGSVLFFWAGWPFLAGGVSEARAGQPGMMLLITMAITVAYAASMATSLDWFELDFWWELAALITIMLLGHWQEMRALGQARGALAALAELLPDDAELVSVTGELVSVSTGELRAGDVVLVRSGGRIPADGEIAEGAAELDESMITGESRPVAKVVGDGVVAGTIATDSAIRVRVTAVGDDTALAGIQRLVAEAEQSKSGAQVLADRAAALLFYVAAGAATVTFAIWWAIGDLDEAVVRVVTVLVISCPHALGLAIPLTSSLSSAKAAQNGILVKSRLQLEESRSIDAVLFDKTGTLTRSEHIVAGVAAAEGWTTKRVLAVAGGVESDSEHPLAKAIVRAASEHGELARATEFRSITGRGVEAVIDGEAFAVGGPTLLRERDLTVPAELADDVADWQARGAAVLFLAGPSGIVGVFELEDEIRPEARQAVAALQRLGKRVVMITGDARQVAEAVGAELGVDEVFAEVLPEDKDAKVAELQQRGLKVAMVGDGVNDAPALARADVGIAIGAGTDVAMESAGIVLASSDPRAVVSIIRLAQATQKKSVQNLFAAAGYNTLAIPLAAGALAWAGLDLPPAVGAVLMSASTIVVAANAQLLRRVEIDVAKVTARSG